MSIISISVLQIKNKIIKLAWIWCSILKFGENAICSLKLYQFYSQPNLAIDVLKLLFT